MKVIHLISGGDTGGAKTHVLSLLYNLSKTMDVTLVCFRRGPFSDEAEGMGIRTLIPEGGFFRSLRRIRGLIDSEGFDLIHCHGSRANLAGALLRGALRLPVLSTVHSDYRLDYLGRPLAAMTYGRLNLWALRRIKYHVGVSEAMRRLLISRGFRASTSFAIYNGIDFQRAAPLTDSAAFYKRVGADVNDGDVVVGIAARLDPVKDVATMIRGFAMAREKAPNLKLIIAGDGQERETLSALAKSLGCGEALSFAGWLEDMDEFYASLHVNALTSISETFPYAITEGAFHRLPTVSSRVGGIPQIITHGETGLLFEAGDADALADCLVTLANDGELRQRLGRAIHERAARDFSIAETCREQREVYEEILRREALPKDHREGVLICGAYGMGNAGDEAILLAIVREMRSIDAKMPITVLSRRPAEAMLNTDADAIHTFDFPGFRREAKRARLYINGGGSLIQDVTSRRSLWYYLNTIRTAKRLGCRVQMYGCGIGPVLHETDIAITRRILNRYVDAVTLREPDSLDELSRFGVTKPTKILASDPALTLSAAPEREVKELLIKNGAEAEGRYICLALRDWPGFEEKAPCFAAAAKYALERYGLTPLFLPINHRNDAAAAAKVTALLEGAEYRVIPGPMPAEMTIGLMARMDIVVSMRLHGLIFAAGQGVPLVGVSYDPKVTAFLRYIGSEACVELSELTADGLCKLIDGAAAMRDKKEELAESVRRLRDIEGRNVETARFLLEKESAT